MEGTPTLAICTGGVIAQSGVVNGRGSTMSEVEGIMEAIRDPNIHTVGLCGNDDYHIGNILDTVERRIKRDDLFGKIVMESIRENKPNLIRIQEEIAHQLGFSLQGQLEGETVLCYFPCSNKKAVTENARQLNDRIRAMPKILFIFRDLRTELDLAKLGVPQQLCKLILISQSEDILSNHMNAQRIFSV